MTLAFLRLSIASATLLAVLLTGCETDIHQGSYRVVPCSELSERRSAPAELTGAPAFSDAEIAAGDPLTLSVPVNGNTRAVRVHIDSADDPTIGAAASGETAGAGIVVLQVQDTELPAGTYWASRLFLESQDRSTIGDSVYLALAAADRYRQSASLSPGESLACNTEIPTASFTVRDD